MIDPVSGTKEEDRLSGAAAPTEPCKVETDGDIIDYTIRLSDKEIMIIGASCLITTMAIANSVLFDSMPDSDKYKRPFAEASLAIIDNYQKWLKLVEKLHDLDFKRPDKIEANNIEGSVGSVSLPDNTSEKDVPK